MKIHTEISNALCNLTEDCKSNDLQMEIAKIEGYIYGLLTLINKR